MFKKRYITLAFVFSTFIFSSLFFTKNASAYISIDALGSKSRYQAIKACYDGGAFKTKDFSPVDNYNSTTGAVKDSAKAPMPYTSTNSGGIIKCPELINSFYGSLPPETDTARITSYLADLGYVKTEDGTDSQACFHFELGTNRTNSVCYLYNDKGNLDTDSMFMLDDGSGPYSLYTENRMVIKFYDSNQQKDPTGQSEYLFDIMNIAADPNGITKSALDSAVASGEAKLISKGLYSDAKGIVDGTDSSISNKYSMNDTSAAALSYLKKHSGLTGFDDSAAWFTQYEQHSYYKYYLMDYWGLIQDEENCSKSPAANRIPFKTAGDITYCGLKNSSGVKVDGPNLNGTVTPVHDLYLLNKWGRVNDTSGLTISNAMDAINSLDYSVMDSNADLGAAPCVPGEEEGCEEEEDDEGGGGGGVDPADPADSSGWSLDKCYEVAGVAGWIVCPAVDFMKTVMESAYNGLIQPMLEAKPGILGSDTQKAWGTFRDFANSICAFILLLVILSQVTGYGIDNYGIKRMLPKLIIGAILVNFSFFICKVSLDIANIVGIGLQNMLSSIGGSGTDLGTHIGSMVGGLLTFAVGGTLAVGAGVALTGGWAFLLPAILALISGVISFLFLFVILGVRQAGIIILAVASPVALVLYVLPNTQSWAKRWVKMFGQLLLAYPVIGAVIGGCYAASNIIMGIGGNEFWTYLAGTLLAVVPYLMIPTILRSSMTALGALGTAVTGFGQRMAGGITGAAGNAIRQSGAFQSTLNRSAGLRADRTRRAETQSAQRTIDRLNRIKARGGTLSARQEGELNRAKRTMNANVRADAADRRAEMEYERINSPAGQAALERGLEAEAETAAIRDESAVLDRGGYKYDASAVAAGAPSGTVDANNLDSLKQALEYETSQDGPQNVARIMALKQMMESKYAKKGIDAVGDVIDSGKMKGEGAKRVINSVASDGNYKNQARSIFGAANDIKKDTAFQASGAVAGGRVSTMRNNGGQVGNMKAENIGQMTDNEFNAFVAQMVNPDKGIRDNAGRMAQEALDDDSIRSQLNSDQIAQLETLARNTGQVSAASALQQEQDRVFNIQQQAIDQSHQQFAFAQGTDKDGFYVAPSGWKTIHVNGGGANNNRYATDPNNPNRVYDRKTNKFINR